MSRPPRIAVAHNDPDPSWRWVLDRTDTPVEVSSFAMVRGGETSPLARLRQLGAARALWRAHDAAPFDLVLSFGPYAAMRVGLTQGARVARHDCFAFNFTDLPGGPKRLAMRRGLRRLGRGYVLTRAERSLYATAFGLPEAAFVRVPWGVTPPEPAPGALPGPGGPYVSALGGEARDYATLVEAARHLPGTRFVVVARPRNLEDLDLPPNVETLTNIPFAEAWRVVARSQLHVLPLRSRDTPCGIVTLVGAMHLGVPQVVTEAVGVTDYAAPGVHALNVPARDPKAMAGAIDALMGDEARRVAIGAAAAARAREAYGEATTLRFAERLVREAASASGS